MSTTIHTNLTAFCEQQQIKASHFGSVCTLIYITRRARRDGLPLRLDWLASRRGGQVAGLHQGAVRAILDEYGMAYEPLGEAGRTNPGSLAYAIAYASFLNAWPDLDRQSLAVIERCDSYDLQVTCSSAIVFATFFPNNALLHTLRVHLRRRRRKLIVTLDQHTPVINQVIDEAHFSRFVDVLSIEQWLMVYLGGAAGTPANEQGRRIETLIQQYGHLRQVFTALPKLALSSNSPYAQFTA